MNGKDFDYYIAATTNMEKSKKFVEYIVPECTWGIFECVGPLPKAIQDLQKRIVTEWLPTSGYEYADAPDIEVYFDGNQRSDGYRCEYKEVLKMPSIRPISDLRNNANVISEFCHQTREPIYITKNGVGDMAVMSVETYELQQALINLYTKLAEAEEEIANGAEGEDFFEVAKQLRSSVHGQL